MYYIIDTTKPAESSVTFTHDWMKAHNAALAGRLVINSVTNDVVVQRDNVRIAVERILPHTTGK